MTLSPIPVEKVASPASFSAGIGLSLNEQYKEAPAMSVCQKKIDRHLRIVKPGIESTDAWARPVILAGLCIRFDVKRLRV